jgi:hypothetical protein
MPVALQGTIDSFAVGDVLRLLANASKTGRLVVNGERGSVSMWLNDGDMVGGQTSSDPGAVDLVDICFDVLRYEGGSFIFESDAHCPNPQPPAPVGAVLEQAEAFLSEWRDIVSVVPSMAAWVTLADELPHPEVVVDQACWTSIIAVGSGATVTQLCEQLGLAELPASRLVRALVHAGFITVAEHAPEPVTTGLSDGGYPADEATGDTFPGGTDLFAPGQQFFDPSNPSADDPFGEFDPFGSSGGGSNGSDGLALPSLTISGLTDDPFSPEAFPATTYSDEAFGGPNDGVGTSDADGADDGDSDEGIARELSMLSPQAAQAVAAAEYDGTRDSGDDDDGRDHVIRFLGSV